ncbi:hypothetical protein RUE5091_00138 [Ruegeria denitrificans]|uniref:Uncharacterized protein n=1 Tax=Ruegeria denitrificans TaxID=1715692 RepID=A0A0P1IDD9_9RHOB|nr:hypothetical protein [Ruegeria denitrificans]CUJ83705.1 hypothetical protein RUE5091_00138 [Ruegeria denitrificans]
MIFLDTRWKPGPKARAIAWGEADAPESHVFPKNGEIQFPPLSQRLAYDRPLPDLWAALLTASDWTAFTALGPIGDGTGSSEPVREWQDTLDRLRSRDTDALRCAVDYHRDAGRLVIDTCAGLDIRATTLGAYLDATAYADLLAGREIGQCGTCGRHMVKLRSDAAFCSTRCRMQHLRDKKKGHA